MQQSISGFPELLPNEQIAWNNMCAIISKQFETIGALPLETAIVERVQTIVGKSSDDKEIYALRRLVCDDPIEAQVDLALRFDLTVPLARYITEHQRTLVFPFTRYQIQPVWRGERAQKGRYRQFTQADIDVIGDGSLALEHDAQLASLMYTIFKKLDIGPFVIRINNRKILNGVLEYIGLQGEKANQAMRIIDNVEKIGQEACNQQISALGVKEEDIQLLNQIFATNQTDIFAYLKAKKLNQIFAQGVAELDQVIQTLESFGVPKEYYQVDISIARGLDYYTSTVYETRLLSHPQIGSICSGGRYDNLTTQIGSKNTMPGVGMSIGLTRLFAALIEKNIVECEKKTTADVLVTTMDKAYMDKYIGMANQLRQNNIKTELYLEHGKFAKQLKYANRKNIAIAIIAGADEFAADTIKIRLLQQGDEITIGSTELVDTVKKYLG